MEHAGAPVDVFDTAFIADNIFAGELIDLSHDRGLFSIIIGTEGVKLAVHLERFNAIQKACATALKEAETALADDKPVDLLLNDFFALGPNPAYERRLEQAELALKSVQQADKIAALTSLEQLSLCALPSHLNSILISTVADVDASARAKLLDHFKRFALDKKGEAWINYGVEHIHEDSCPFCGRDEVDANGMVTLYGQIFGEVYKTHLETITAALLELDASLGEGARNDLATKIATNAESASKWAEYVALDFDFPDMATVGKLIADLNSDAKTLLDRKRNSPLDVISASSELEDLGAKLSTVWALINKYNAAVVAANINAQKAVAATTITEEAATLARDNVKKRIQRHDPGVQNRVDAYIRAARRDKRARDTRTQVQKRLKKANEDAAEHYHTRVNRYLGRFGASFTISKITNSMQGNAGQSDYGLLIKGEAIARGRGRQADAIPTFRNTLSAGDKTTLAFAFFLTKLDQDSALAGKTIVIDDPLSSHDSHRRRETVNAVKDLCARCAQVVVLSHDEFLLREVQQRCSGVPATALQIDYDGADEWSVAKGIDIDKLCRAGHAKLVEEIANFVDNRNGDADEIVLKIRQVLETHYRRSYSGYFDHDLNLGKIVQAIATAGSAHPCHRDLTRIDNCNDATCDKHHGDDAVVVVKRGVDPDELRVIARDALELVGARQPIAAPTAAAVSGSTGAAYVGP